MCLVRYDSKRVVQQLSACGVLETIHISAQIYPSRWAWFWTPFLTLLYTCKLVSSNLLWIHRWTYVEFYSRYSILMTQQEVGLNDKKQTCKTVLQRLIQVSKSTLHNISLFLTFLLLSVNVVLYSSLAYTVQLWGNSNIIDQTMKW